MMKTVFNKGEQVGSYHNLLPTYLQDVLKQAVKQGVKDEGDDEQRFLDPAYVGALDRAIRRARESFPQAFKAI